MLSGFLETEVDSIRDHQRSLLRLAAKPIREIDLNHRETNNNTIDNVSDKSNNNETWSLSSIMTATVITTSLTTMVTTTIAMRHGRCR